MLALLSKLVVVLLAASPAIAERSTLCDDGGPLTCVLSTTLSGFTCGDVGGLVALQGGCILCVNPTTCLGLGPAIQMNAAQDNTRPLPKANGNDISVLLQDQADYSPEESAATVNAKLAGAATQVRDSGNGVESPREVSNWLFSIPVCLAVVSLGLAIRARVPSRRGFKRLQDRNRSPLFQEDINPFCSNEMDENMAIETAGHFHGDPSNSESEEAQFLPSAELEDDEFTQAESEAIKQAVLLHIREFDAEEDEEVEI
ncbi:hypothetical protein PRNP1_005431 [Phytophthora ramorum]